LVKGCRDGSALPFSDVGVRESRADEAAQSHRVERFFERLSVVSSICLL
jgi:hypothetical protein